MQQSAQVMSLDFVYWRVEIATTTPADNLIIRMYLVPILIIIMALVAIFDTLHNGVF